MLRWLPENISVEGKDIDFLFRFIDSIVTVTFILVATLMVIFLVKYRRKPGVRATYTHGNNALEMIWTIIPSMILVLLMFMTHSSWAGIVFVVFFAAIYMYLNRTMGELGAEAPRNPWDANTLEWVAPTPVPHGNFGPSLPVVQRGSYEYSVPQESDDWAPQTKAMEAGAAAH